MHICNYKVHLFAFNIPCTCVHLLGCPCICRFVKQRVCLFVSSLLICLLSKSEFLFCLIFFFFETIIESHNDDDETFAYRLQGATTFSITTLSITTISITTLGIFGLFATLSISVSSAIMLSIIIVSRILVLF
jgi:hypothetical protein